VLRGVARSVLAVALTATAGYLLASRGPLGLRGEYRRRVAEVASGADAPSATQVVRDSDLAHLPPPVAAYVRKSGAVGRPRIVAMHAVMHGRLRSGPDAPWMPFVAEQVNSFTGVWSRLFFMKATMRGMPVDVLHVYESGRATMRAKLCSVLSVIDASGADMSRAERVTVANDVCVMAPGVLPFMDVAWEELDARRARATFRIDGSDVRAELVFDEAGTLVDFVSDDRLRADPQGRSFTRQRWSTPILEHSAREGRVLARRGEVHWHAPDPEGEFAYMEFAIDTVDTAPAVAGVVQPGNRSSGSILALSSGP
jgi:hypothetical protein